MTRRGRPVDANSRASRILTYLRTRPNEAVPTRDIANALGLEIAQVTGALGTKMSVSRREHADPEWLRVVHAMHGAWTYQTEAPTLPDEPGEWTALGEQNDAVVLRGPDGRLWIARPL